MCQLGFTPVSLPPDDLQGKHNIPSDDENGGNGGGLPPIPVGPAAPWQHMQQPPAYPPQPQFPNMAQRTG